LEKETSLMLCYFCYTIPALESPLCIGCQYEGDSRLLARLGKMMELYNVGV
jgi:hypothetical protein